MLVVLPVCNRDCQLAKWNLELLQLLEPSLPLPFDCLITTDDGYDPAQTVAAAKTIFRSVKVYRYGRSWNGAPPPWPWPQNWAWQQSAKHIERTYGQTPSKKKGQHWFWWEQDCAPLLPGAFSRLADASAATNKPFAGYVEIRGAISYMAGPGLYPLATSKHLDRALMARKAPFDIVASQEDGLIISGKIENLAHIIYHRWREDNLGDQFSSKEDLARLIPANVCFYHRSDDGSLQWLLSEGATGLKAAVSLDRYNPRKQSLADTQTLCRELLTSPHAPTPRLANQLPWAGGLFSLPLTAGEIHFNCASVSANGQTRLLTRHTRNNRNSIVIWNLDTTTMTASEPETLAAPRPNEHYEDPRCLWWPERERYVLTLCNYDLTRHHFAHQTILELSPAFSTLEQHHVEYGRNGGALHANSGHEKNWVPFIHNGHLHVIYSINPHVVLRLDGTRKAAVHQTGNARVAWPWGELRGGAPPFRVGEEYISFFHSSTPWRMISGAAKRRYYCGAYAFNNTPPFRVTRLTKAPLLVGSESDPLLQWSPLVVFPGGATLEADGNILLTGGCNDACCFWQRLPLSTLNEQLTAV